MRLELLYFDDCPHWKVADSRLRLLASERGLKLERRRVTSPEEAERVGFRGSPTILVDGRDPFARQGQSSGLACRLYDTPDGPAGVPTEDQLRYVIDGRGRDRSRRDRQNGRGATPLFVQSEPTDDHHHRSATR